MTFGHRLLQARERRLARSLGFEAALGLLDEPPPTRAAPPGLVLACPRCGGSTCLEALDLRTGRGRVRCQGCDHAWSVVYET
jgi:predicted Zn finger-like uncharacterized protein